MQASPLSLVPAGAVLNSVLDPLRPCVAGAHQAVQAAVQASGTTLVQA